MIYNCMYFFRSLANNMQVQSWWLMMVNSFSYFMENNLNHLNAKCYWKYDNDLVFPIFQVFHLETPLTMTHVLGYPSIHQWRRSMDQNCPLLPGYIAMLRVWNVASAVLIYIHNLPGAKCFLIFLVLYLNLPKMV